MDVLELAIDLLSKGGGLAGIGGGIIATRVLSRVSEGLKHAKDAFERSKSAEDKSKSTAEELEKIKQELKLLHEQVEHINRQSLSGIDPATATRIGQLETRMSAVEDDVDAQTRENKRSWESIQRAVGRIEGTLTGHPRGR